MLSCNLDRGLFNERLTEYTKDETLDDNSYATGYPDEKIILFSESPTVTSLRALRFRETLCDFSPFTDKESSSSSTSTTLLPEAPDGGYGWVIVFASFMIHFICDGISFSFGILFPQIQENFHTTTTMSGIIGSIFLSLPLLLGPIAGVLTDIYDCRKMTITGGIIAAAGAFISYFAFGVWQFLFTFGVIVGAGLCLCFNTAIVAVTYYFQNKRALATGIAVCGSGAGTAVFAPFLEMLFAKFGWRITLLFLGLLLLLLVGCGLLIKDLEWPQDTLEYKRKKFIEKSERAKLSNLIEAEQETVAATAEAVYGDVALRHAISLPLIPLFTEWCLEKTSTSVSKHSIPSKSDAFSRCQSEGTFLCTLEKKKDPKSSVFPPLCPRSPKSLEGTIPTEILTVSHSTAALGEMPVEPTGVIKMNRVVVMPTDDGEKQIQNPVEAKTKTTSRFGENVVEQKDKEKPVCVVDIDAKNGDVVKKMAVVSDRNEKPNKLRFKAFPATALLDKEIPRIPNSYGAAQGRVPASNVVTFGWRYYGFNNLSHRAPSAPVIFFRRKRKSRVINVTKILESCDEWLTVVISLLSVPSFSVFLVSTFMLYLFFDIPYVNFPEHATQHLNVTDTQASYLVATIGVFNTISMLVCGLLADWSVMKNYLMQLYGGFIFFAGACVLLAPFVTSYYILMLLCACFGFFISANYVLASVITVHLLCLYDFQTGYGLLCLVEGLGNLVGPGLVGYVRDHQSSYHYIFVYGGLGTVLSGLMVIGIDVFLRFRKASNETSNALSSHGESSRQIKSKSPEDVRLFNGTYEVEK